MVCACVSRWWSHTPSFRDHAHIYTSNLLTCFGNCLPWAWARFRCITHGKGYDVLAHTTIGGFKSTMVMSIYSFYYLVLLLLVFEAETKVSCVPDSYSDYVSVRKMTKDKGSRVNFYVMTSDAYL